MRYYCQKLYSKARIKEQVIWGFKLTLFLYIRCFLQNQPENVLKVFLKLLLQYIEKRTNTRIRDSIEEQFTLALISICKRI